MSVSRQTGVVPNLWKWASWENQVVIGSNPMHPPLAFSSMIHVCQRSGFFKGFLHEKAMIKEKSLLDTSVFEYNAFLRRA